jgi:hypothetical protein
MRVWTFGRSIRGMQDVTASLRVILSRDEVTAGDGVTLPSRDQRLPAAVFTGYWFRDRRSEAGLPHCSAYGLRKASLRETAQASRSEDIHRLDQRPQ